MEFFLKMGNQWGREGRESFYFVGSLIHSAILGNWREIVFCCHNVSHVKKLFFLSSKVWVYRISESLHLGYFITLYVYREGDGAKLLKFFCIPPPSLHCSKKDERIFVLIRYAAYSWEYHIDKLTWQSVSPTKILSELSCIWVSNERRIVFQRSYMSHVRPDECGVTWQTFGNNKKYTKARLLKLQFSVLNFQNCNYERFWAPDRISNLFRH